MSQIKGIHPMCEIFPMMDDAALEKLSGDIGRNGLLNPIVVHEGLIVDGRNRATACESAGVTPRVIEWSEVYGGPMGLSQWVWSTNVERRHLTPEQIAMAITVRRWMEEREAARVREVEGGAMAGRGRPMEKGVRDPAHPIDTQKQQELAAKKKGKTRTVLAEEAGVSTYQIQRAMDIQKAAEENKIPADVPRKVIQGSVSAKDVHDQILGKSQKTKRQGMLENAAKNRMVDALSVIRGACRNLEKLKVPMLQSQGEAAELREWSKLAVSLAKVLRSFGIALSER